MTKKNRLKRDKLKKTERKKKKEILGIRQRRRDFTKLAVQFSF